MRCQRRSRRSRQPSKALVTFPQFGPGNRHAPAHQIVEGRQAYECLEALGESRSRHSNGKGQVFDLQRRARSPCISVRAAPTRVSIIAPSQPTTFAMLLAEMAEPGWIVLVS